MGGGWDALRDGALEVVHGGGGLKYSWLGRASGSPRFALTEEEPWRIGTFLPPRSEVWGGHKGPEPFSQAQPGPQ